MDVILMIIAVTIVLGFLVFIHEGGHYLAARAFGVRVSEFMLGLPGPSVGFTYGETRFGVTLVPLGGYARICGMGVGESSPHLERVLGALYARGTATSEVIAADCRITTEEATDALDELCEWGSVVGPKRKDPPTLYRTPRVKPTRRQIRRAQAQGQPAPASYELGAARSLDDVHAFFQQEYRQQYQALPFWKRSVILLAGVTVNLLFSMVAFILIYSVIGIDVQNPDTGVMTHMTVDPLRSIQAGFIYIGMVTQAVIGLFNPQTAAETVSNSTSIVGIAVMSKMALEQGLVSFLSFTAMISVSLGIINLVPIPPLDGGRFVVEIYQKISRRAISEQALGGISFAGLILFIGFFIFMLNQDIQRTLSGFWG